MSQDTDLNQLIINKLTEAQFQSLVDAGTVSETELYMITDGDMEVTTDNKSITKNGSGQIQTVGVIDQSDNNTALKYWSGTRAEYDAISTKDSNTFYNVTDDFNATYNKGFLGQIIPSPIPLSDACLYPLNGDIIAGTGIYGEFVDYMGDLYDELSSQITTEYDVNIIGSLTNTGGVLSGFSTTNYAKLPDSFNPQSSEWEIIIPYITTNISSAQYILGSENYGVCIGLNDSGQARIYLSSNNSSWDIADGTASATALSANTQYYFKLTRTTSSYVLSVSTDKTNYTTHITVTSSATIPSSQLKFGISRSNVQPATYGSIDLNDAQITVGGSIWWNGVNHLTPCFCTEAEWQTAVTTYGVCGKFVYDSVNNTVRLPKYNSKIYSGGGEAPVKGNGMILGLTDGTTNAGLINYHGSGYYRNTGNRSAYGQNVTSVGSAYSQDSIYDGAGLGITTDGTKSGIVADLSNITTSLDGYYYIVVATATKTEIQVDIDQIAGDLINKADKDLSNVPNSKGILVESYKSGSSGYNIYSNKYCEQWGNATASSGTTSVSLLKPFSDTNYNVSLGLMASTDNYYITKTTTAITIMSQWQTGAVTTDWRACGYIN